jgi:hypothetical protein
MSTPTTVEERDARWILEACEFSACVWLNGAVQKIDMLNSVFDAGATALIMEAKAGQGRTGMVYAITPQGRSALVPRTIWQYEVDLVLALGEAGARKLVRDRRPAGQGSGEVLAADQLRNLVLGRQK